MSDQRSQDRRPYTTSGTVYVFSFRLNLEPEIVDRQFFHSSVLYRVLVTVFYLPEWMDVQQQFLFTRMDGCTAASGSTTVAFEGLNDEGSNTMFFRLSTVSRSLYNQTRLYTEKISLRASELDAIMCMG